MIPATSPYRAAFKHRNGAGGTYYEYMPVIAWDDEGNPLVACDDGKSQRLLPARTYNNFAHVEPDEQRIIALIPGGGWRVEHSEDDGATWSHPLVAWALQAGGLLVPVETDSDGVAEEVMDRAYRIYHPDALEGPDPRPGAACNDADPKAEEGSPA